MVSHCTCGGGCVWILRDSHNIRGQGARPTTHAPHPSTRLSADPIDAASTRQAQPCHHCHVHMKCSLPDDAAVGGRWMVGRYEGRAAGSVCGGLCVACGACEMCVNPLKEQYICGLQEGARGAAVGSRVDGGTSSRASVSGLGPPKRRRRAEAPP